MKHAVSLLIVFLLGAGLLSGCDQAAGVDETMIRVLNESNVDFDQVVVFFSEEREDYGAVAAGEVSEYRVVEQAYRYAYGEAQVGENEYTTGQLIDHVGETPLGDGRFTYALTLEEEYLSVILIEE